MSCRARHLAWQGEEWETRSRSRPSPRSFDSATHGPRNAGHRHPSYERGLKWKASDGLLWRNSAGFFHFRHAEDKDEHPLAPGLVFWSGVAGASIQSRWVPLGPLNPGTIDNTGGVPLPRARRQSFLLQDRPECVAVHPHRQRRVVTLPQFLSLPSAESPACAAGSGSVAPKSFHSITTLAGGTPGPVA